MHQVEPPLPALPATNIMPPEHSKEFAVYEVRLTKSDGVMTVTANDQLRIKGHKKISPRQALAIPREKGEGKAKQTFKDPGQSLLMGLRIQKLLTTQQEP